MTVNLSLNETLQAFVKEQMKQYGYNTVSEYMRDLLRAAKRRAAQSRLDQLLIEGMESGPSTPMTGDDWKRIRASVQRRLSQKRQS